MNEDLVLRRLLIQKGIIQDYELHIDTRATHEIETNRHGEPSPVFHGKRGTKIYRCARCGKNFPEHELRGTTCEST